MLMIEGTDGRRTENTSAHSQGRGGKEKEKQRREDGKMKSVEYLPEILGIGSRTGYTSYVFGSTLKKKKVVGTKKRGGKGILWEGNGHAK